MINELITQVKCEYPNRIAKISTPSDVPHKNILFECNSEISFYVP